MRLTICSLAAALFLTAGAAFAQDAAPAPDAAAQTPATSTPATQAPAAQAPDAAQAPADAAQAPADTTPPPADTGAAPEPMPVEAPPPAPTNPPMTGPRLLIATSMGDIVLQLDSVRAPKTVANVLRYVRSKHYDGTVFYRVQKGFVIQMGSWDANVHGRPGRLGPVPFEGANGLSNLRGSVALAHGDNATDAGADFFINLVDNTPLDHQPADTLDRSSYAVFGEVASGMDVVDAIAKVPVGEKGPMPGYAPVTPITIKKVTIVK